MTRPQVNMITYEQMNEFIGLLSNYCLCLLLIIIFIATGYLYYKESVSNAKLVTSKDIGRIGACLMLLVAVDRYYSVESLLAWIALAGIIWFMPYLLKLLETRTEDKE